MNSAQKTKLKKLIVAVAASVERTTADPAIHRSPTVTPFCSRSGGGSSGWMRARSAPDPRNENASRRSAPGAVNAWTRNPAAVGPDDEREGPAPVEQCARLDEAIPWHDRLEQGRVRDPEQYGQRAGDEGHDVQLFEGQQVEHVRDRDRRDHARSTDIGSDHRPTPVPVPIDPCAGVQGEEEVRGECERRQVSHLSCIGVECEHCDERQREERDLVAEQRDGVRSPVAAEDLALAEQLRDRAPNPPGTERRRGHRSNGIAIWRSETARAPAGRSSGWPSRSRYGSPSSWSRSRSAESSSTVR